jgi:hypothetical protein
MANIIDELFIALGFKVDPSGLNDLKSKTKEAQSALLGIGTAIKVALGGFAVREIASIGSAFEQNRLQIAGFLSALGLSSDFNAGLKDAETVIKKITKDAALLPGEAEEYVEVFKTNAAFLKNGMPGANPFQIADFTNKLTAVAKTVDAKMDAGQISREAGMLLAARGRAGAHNVLFTKLLPFMMQVEGQAKLTADSFNRMTQPQRVKLLQDTFALLDPALKEASHSFDALVGAAESMAKTVTRLTTAGLFEGMKEGLDSITALFLDSDSNPTELTKELAEAGKAVSHVVVQMVSAFGGFATMLLKNESAMKVLKFALMAVGIALSGLALQQTVGWFGKMILAVFNLKKLLMGGLFVAIALIAEDLYTFMTGGDSVIGMLLEKFPLATKIAIGAIGALGLAFVATKIQMVLGLVEVATTATATGASMAAAFSAALGPIALVIAALMLGGTVGKNLSDQINALQVPDSLKNFKSNVDENGKFRREMQPEDFLAKKPRPTSELGPLSPALNVPTSRDLPMTAQLNWNPASKYTPASAAPLAPAAATTVNVGDIYVKSDNPNQAGENLLSAIVRNSQTRFSH